MESNNNQDKARTALPFGNRAAILNAEDNTVKLVDVPEWNCRVAVRGLSAGERDVWEKLVSGRLSEEESKKHFKGFKAGPNHSRALLVFYGTLAGEDISSGRMFHDPTDMMALARKQAAAISRIAEVVIELSAISEEDVEEIEGEYDRNPTFGDSTNSPKSSKSGTSKGSAPRLAADS